MVQRLFQHQRPYMQALKNGQTASVERLERELESDRGRIINSAAVRRLQQKTQVFPLERNAAVRSRLTHSLEVQQTGRFITREIFRKLKQRDSQHEFLHYERAAESMVEMACLMHDIGNPPFGHFGEAALSAWFADHVESLPAFAHTKTGAAETLREQVVRELQSFEGNAQGIRIIAALQKLNLTYAQTACILKYTRPATDPRPDDAHPLSYLQKKPGFYLSEQPFIEDLQAQLGLQPGHRYPLTYVMEAADDISYCLADLEDGVDKGLLSYQALATYLIDEFSRQYPQDPDGDHFKQKSFAKVVRYALQRAENEAINKEHEFFVWLRVQLVHPLVDHAAEQFHAHWSTVMDGSFNRALLEDDSAAHAVIETFKKVASAYVFSSAEVETLELQGYHIIHQLLEHYRPLLMLSHTDFSRLQRGERKGLLIVSRLYNRLPKKHVKAYAQLAKRESADPEVWEMYCRCRLLQDMISGMTDEYALDEYRTLSAIAS
ncbi:dGTPase [Aliidiomarina halalkaliphila]|uniref:dGTPase n=1 Tax=Aliidiomarina halalkaliphila TaxID=2593535 RepID=A0A552X037_9GAMM|nr:dGTPase [Aliidiomarina halalkaliphila]TRW48428.1 dGTPase [Aliidiomarina halalkaliphila]